MDDRCVVDDEYTYEHGTIKAWLELPKVSPVTRLRLLHSPIVSIYSVKSLVPLK